MSSIRFLIVVILSLHLLATKAFSVPPTNRARSADFRRVVNANGAPTSLSALPAAAKSVSPAGKSSASTVIAGRLFPFVSNFFIGPAKWREITKNVGGAVEIGDLLLIAVLGWVVLPLSALVFKRRHRSDDPLPDFRKSRLYTISSLTSQIAKIAGVIYIIDVLAITLNAIDIKFPYNKGVTMKCAQVLYTLWAVLRFVPYKKGMISRRINDKSPDDAPTKIKILDTLANIFIAVPTAFVLLDELAVPVGRALKSLFALGGVGTLVFSLASKDVAGQVVNGVALASSNKYDEGDTILLGDGTQGTVSNMGWLYTELRGTDEIAIKIPNSQLANQRMSNLSRLKNSQVKQTLWFNYDIIDKLPALIKDIKTEISDFCPSVITDGSRPFRVSWTNYKDTHLELVVNCHFRHPPNTDVYWDTRQDVLLAVARAAKQANVRFEIPSVRVKTTGKQEESTASNPQQLYGIEESSADGRGSKSVT